MILKQIRIVLVRPSHPGNIGAAARAMKNMGLSRLCLVAPENFPSEVATSRASGAESILEKARIFDCLHSAVSDCHHVITTTARQRSLKWENFDARTAAQKICAFDPNEKVAVVFGPERTGLSNDEIGLSQCMIHIPVNESFPSMNLAAAVMLICYEIRLASLAEMSPLILNRPKDEPIATNQQVQGFVSHLHTVMEQTGFLTNKPSDRLLRRVRRLFNRAAMSEQDVNILRGVLAGIQSKLNEPVKNADE